MVDVFSEVDEQLRAERLRSFMQRAVPAFIAALVLSVLAVAGVQGWQMYQASQSAKAAQAYQAALNTAAQGDGEKAFQQFDGLAKQAGPYQALALMQQGGIRMDQNKIADAAALFDKAAAASKSPVIADMAALKSAYAVLDTAPLVQLEAKLTPLTAAGRPYRVQAREALALARLADAKTAAAKSDLVAIAAQIGTPDSARQRAQAIISLIDSGTAGGLKKLAEEAKTATPIPLPGQPGPQTPPGVPVQAQPEAAQ
ncbi:MAG: tetratricopeptide repeat protein [Caulobacteraceae bacterium]